MTDTLKTTRPTILPGKVVSTVVVILIALAGGWVIAYGIPTGEARGWWVLIGTTGLLAVAIIGLRYVDPRRMSLLKKCLIVSVLLHVLIAWLFGAVAVTKQVVKWVQPEYMTPAVNLNLSREMEVREQVRQQVQQLPPLFDSTALVPQQVDSPLPPVTPNIEPVGVPQADLRQLSMNRNPIAPTIPMAPAAPEMVTPLMPVHPEIAPTNVATPLPNPIADVTRPPTHFPGPIDEQLATASTVIPGSGPGILVAPPASLAHGSISGGSATGSGTGRPFTLWNGNAPPPTPLPPQVVVSPPTPTVPDIAPPTPAAQDILPPRGFDRRQEALRKHGGTPETEAAVARALLYLSRTQHVDGHWTKMLDKPNEKSTDDHDPALTALAVLCFLAADHTPDKPGPYQENVRRGIAYLLAIQRNNGDLRGDGNMYDQGIATLALGEAALMTGNRIQREAAHRGAQFILEAQNNSGGWRYAPNDLFTDTSVTGWQVMALHSAERSGFVIPPGVRRSTLAYLDKLSSGKQGMLTGYLTKSPSPSMTSEAIFSRMLFSQALTRDQLDEAASYLQKQLPAREGLNYYYIYYGSLAMMQMQGPAWERWNASTSRLLLALQEQKGPNAGSWDYDPDNEWGSRGGRIYTTTMGCLSLEVYYRYLPLYDKK